MSLIVRLKLKSKLEEVMFSTARLNVCSKHLSVAMCAHIMAHICGLCTTKT